MALSPISRPGAIERFALILGAMKSGTTTLFRLLERHPAVAPARDKEPNFFTRAELRDRGRGWYEELWDFDPQRHRWALEASTEYTKLPVFPSGAPFIARLDAEVRFIYLLRDPLERIRSEVNHGLAQGFARGPVHHGLDPAVVATSNYRFQLWPYVQTFGRDRILVLHLRDLQADPAGTAARVFRFLDLEAPATVSPGDVHNAGGGFTQINVARVLARRGVVPELFDVEAIGRLPQAQFEALCAQLAREAGQPEALAAARAEHERNITPSPEQARRVRELLREDLDRFRDDWGVDPWSEANRAALDGAQVLAA